MLYTVTTCSSAYDPRTPAICTTLERARHIVESNAMNIHETSYRYAVIGEIQPDYTYPECVAQHWYEWNSEAERYQPCEKPQQFALISGDWGIG